VALVGLVALASAMGIGRFAFTPLLPMMLHDGVIDLQGGGALATANYLGYLAGALACMFIQASPARMIRAGLLATFVFTAAMVLVSDTIAWALLRALAGAASACVFVFVSGWCMSRLVRHPELAAIIFCGPGIGIALTGFAASGMVAAGWRADHGWLLFGLIALVCMALVWRTVSPEARAGLAQEAGRDGAEPGQVSSQAARRILVQGWFLTVAYGLAGFGYIITATFLPVMARQSLPDSIWPDLFWPMLGVAVAFGPLMATRVSAEADQRLWLSGCYVMQAAGVLMTVVSPTIAGFALGSVLVGLPFTAITLFAVREARRLTCDQGEAASRRLVGKMTAAFSVGQIAGPPFAVWLAGRSQGNGAFAMPLLIAALSLLVGVALYFRMRHAEPLRA
jgi:predicted MFS family arabinose efflux permease